MLPPLLPAAETPIDPERLPGSSRSSRALNDGALLLKSISKLKDLSWAESNGASRQRALQRWRFIIEVSPEHFAMGRQLLTDIAMGGTQESASSILSDIFALKATKTLLARSGPIILYIEFCNSKLWAPFPVNEAHAYAFEFTL